MNCKPAVKTSLHLYACNQNFHYLCSLFIDFSLCEFGFADCHVDAICIDREGGYDCQCDEGYTGNGTHCDGMYVTYVATADKMDI